MSIKNDNKCRMRQGFPELYKRVYEHNSEKKIEKDFIIGVNHLSTPSGKDALVIAASSGEIYRMNSMYDPENEAKIWAAGQEIIASNILVFGLGSGYFVKEILKKRKFIQRKEERLFEFVACGDRYEHILKELVK